MDKKILLIYPTPITEAYIHLGIIAAILQEKGFEVGILENTFKKPLTAMDMANYAKMNGYNVAMICMLTIDVLMVYELFRRLKKEKIQVVTAGPHPTDCPEECIENGADIVIRNELEGTLLELIEYWKGKKDLSEILGLTYKEGSQIYQTSYRPRINLDWIPHPNLELFDHELFKGDDGLIKGFHRVFTSRGCPGKCTFCDHKVYEQQMKYHPVEHMLEYVKMVRDKYGITTFSIADDCFMMDHDRVRQFCKGMKELGVMWRANSRANLVTPEILKEMKNSGCHSIAFGIETADSESLERVKKFVRLENQFTSVKMAHEAGLEVYACMMTGFPWETEKHVQSQIDYVKKTWNDVSLYQVSGSLMPFPGTEIYAEYAEKCGFEKYWLRPEYQDFGIQIYQNCMNPLANSCFYQRYLFDDTYIQEEKFFKYTQGYKDKVREFVFLVGKHNLEFMFPNQPIKQKLILLLSRLSAWGYDKFPNLEKKIGGFLFDKFHSADRRAKIEKRRDQRRGFVKNKGYSNPN
jgi:anaerobic magnesium-protoporphyrin IX monomethyl ester cyclase